MDKFSTICGVPIRYSYFGKGEKVVMLLHGYLEAMEVWEEFGGLLGKHYKVVTLDLPGSGWSGRKGDVVEIDFMADVAIGVLNELNIEKTTVIGHSMGGYVAIGVAEKEPELVEKLILLHSTPNADSAEKIELRKKEIELIEAGKKEALARVNPARGFAPENVRRCEDMVEELVEQILMSEDEDIVAVIKGLASRKDKNDVFANLKMDRLFIFGMQDNYIPIEIAKGLEEKFTPYGVITKWIEKAGHMGFVEQPKVALEIIENFIEN